MAGEIPQERRSSGKIIAMFSSASAAGKTTLALNLGTQLRQSGFQAAVVDLDLQFGDVCNYLKIRPEATVYDYQRALSESNDAPVEPFLISGAQIPDIMAAPLDIAEAYHFRPKTAVRILSELKNRYDYIFVDLAAGFDDVNLQVLKAANEIYFIGLVDFVPTVKNMKAAYNTLIGLVDIPEDKIRMILNRNQAKTEIELGDVKALLGREFYHMLPNDFAKSAAAIQKGLPVILTAPDAPLAKGIRTMARLLSGGEAGREQEASGVKKWFSGFLKS